MLDFVHPLYRFVLLLLIITTASNVAHAENHGTPITIHQVEGSKQLLYGPAPAGQEDFEAIAKHGVTRIISVDGAAPDLENAREHGMSYIHIPFGYDTVPIEAQAKLVKAVRQAKGPVYIHCHHGRHRAPAAVAIPFMALDGANHAEAKHLLEVAGTGEEYAGLWKSVAEFSQKGIEGMDPKLVESAPVEPLAATMAILDRHWDNVKEAESAAWTLSESDATFDTRNEALLVYEALFEMDRANEEAPFAEEMALATKYAQTLHTALRAEDFDAADEAYRSLRASCTQCHRGHRN